MGLTGREVVAFFGELLRIAEQNQSVLDSLDAIAADGDHGATFLIGWRTVAGAIEDGDAAAPGPVLLRAAADFAAVGGSIGPLWGTALLRAGRSVGETTSVDAVLAAVAIRAAVDGIGERGGASLGDKTMLDALRPAAEAFASAVAEGRVDDALREGIAAARSGAAATRGLVARRGRSRRLADRTLGQIDPGAASAYLVWATAGICAGVCDRASVADLDPTAHEEGNAA